MTRCTICDGIVAKHDRVCFVCGDPIPGRKQPASMGKCIAMTLVVLVIASLGLSAYFLQTH